MSFGIRPLEGVVEESRFGVCCICEPVGLETSTEERVGVEELP